MCRWTSYFPLLHRISAVFEAHVNERQKAKLHGMKGIKLFSMLPVSSFAAKNVRFDTDGLAEAVGSLRLDRRKEGIWDRFFRMHLGGNQERRVFTNMIDTDGVSVCLHFERPGAALADEDEDEPVMVTTGVAEAAFVRETKRLDARVSRADIPLGIKRTIYVDPGGTTMASCVLEGDCRHDRKEVSCGTAEYRHMASMDRLQDRRTKMIKAAGLEEIVTGVPTPLSASVAGVQSHLRAALGHMKCFLGHYGTKRRRNMRFTAFSRKERAMEAMVNRIAPRGTPTLVVYGAADFPHAMRGSVATPYKRLKRLVGERDNVTLISVGECNTSQKCCRCHARMENVVGEKIVEGKLRRSRLHAVKVCPNCSTTWNRDTNAAKNIRTIFRALRAGRPRPEVFRPTRQCGGRTEFATPVGPSPRGGPLGMQR